MTNFWWALSLASTVLSVEAAVVTRVIVDVTTPAPVVVTRTAEANVVTKEETVSSVTTIFQASTTPVTHVRGTVVTSISTITETPVTQTSTYSTTSISQTVDPSSYTMAVTASKASSTAESSTPAPTASSASPVAATSSTSSLETSPAGGSSLETSSGTSSVGSSSAASSLVSSAVASSAAASAASSAATSAATSAAQTVAAAETTSVSTDSSSSGSSSGSYYADQDIISAIDTNAPPSMFTQEDLAFTLPDGVTQDGSPIHTNKFYGNLYLSEQHMPAYTMPYSMWWSDNSAYPGFGISLTNSSQWTEGPDASADPIEYYINPVGVMSFALSAAEFTDSDDTNLFVSDSDTFSVSTTLTSSSSSGNMSVPLVEGMGMATAIYNGLTPSLLSQIGINTLTAGESPYDGIQKYTASLFNGYTWNIYVTVPDSVSDFKLTVDNENKITGSTSGDGIVVQVGVVPSGGDSVLDETAGMYLTGASFEASVSGDVGTYSISYETAGSSSSGSPLVYAYPHLVESFTSATSSAATDCQVQSTTKGMMTAVKSNKLEMSETLYTDVQWLPYSVNSSFTGPAWSTEALQKIATAVNSEIAQDMSTLSDTDSTYTSGKVLDKFAYIVLVAKEVLGNDDVAKSGLESLVSAFSRFTTNSQQVPLMYDTLLKGITSSAANMDGGSSSDDYGAPYYNDHHFHYGYMVHCAAVVGYVDSALGGSWVSENKDWVNSLIRDVANPSKDDSYFPVFRMFDWFHGHSWAHGMFEAADGKDEESSSEDYNFAYGMKLWGQVVGDSAMEARGDLMLSVMKRSMKAYFYMEDDNQNQPSNFIKNRVPGITFENKCDHTTYFGTNLEYIQGIHMIPITPASGLIRSSAFCQLEWEEKLASIVDSLDSGWAGILRSDQALFDPVGSYEFFSQDNYPTTWLDNGGSLTWYLTLSAGLGGSS